jgi:hypothetical protein
MNWIIGNNETAVDVSPLIEQVETALRKKARHCPQTEKRNLDEKAQVQSSLRRANRHASLLIGRDQT